jgi:hypothetical protein
MSETYSEERNTSSGTTTTIVSYAPLSVKKPPSIYSSRPFSTRCWQHLGIHWRFDLQFHAMIEEARQSFNIDFFMEVFIIGA